MLRMERCPKLTVEVFVLFARRLHVLFLCLVAGILAAGCLGGGGGSGPSAFDAELMVTVSEEDVPESMAGQGLPHVKFYDADLGSGAGAIETAELLTPGSYRIPGLTRNTTIEPKLAGYTFMPASDVVSAQNPAVSFAASPDGATAATLGDASAALNDDDVQDLFVTEDLGADLTAQRLVNLHLWGGSVQDMTYHADEAGQLHLLGSGSIQGDLSVHAPFASVYNALSVGGKVSITAVSGSSWDEHAEGNRLVIGSSNTEIRLHRGAESVTVTGAGNTIVIGGPISSLSVAALGETNIFGAHHIGYLQANGSTVFLDGEPQDGDGSYVVLDEHMQKVQNVVSSLAGVVSMGSLLPGEALTVVSELESLFEDTEVLEHALWLLGETAAPLLSDDFFKDSSPTDEDREAWSATSESGVTVTYETDNAEGLLALREQLMGMFAGGQSDWEHEGDITLYVDSEDNDGFSLEGIMTIDAPKSGDHYDLQDLKNVWMKLEVKTPVGDTMSLEGHVSTNFSNGPIPQSIGIDGAIATPWFTAQGQLYADLFSVDDEVHPARLQFDGAVEFGDLLAFDGHLDVTVRDTPPIHPSVISSQGAKLSFLETGTVLALDSLTANVDAGGSSITLETAVNLQVDGAQLHIETQVQATANEGNWDNGGHLEIQSMVLEHSSGLTLTCTEGTLQVTENDDDTTVEASFAWETPDGIRLAIEWDPAANTITGRIYDSTDDKRADLVLVQETMVLEINYDNGQSEEIPLMF